MARLGMDADAVEQTARELDNKAQELRQLMHTVDNKINHLSSIWDGQDVKQFQSEWTGQHKRLIDNAATAIEGLSKTAKNNAQKQRDTSSQL